MDFFAELSDQQQQDVCGGRTAPFPAWALGGKSEFVFKTSGNVFIDRRYMPGTPILISFDLAVTIKA